MTGLDTGFFVRLLQGHTEAVRVWKTILEGEASAVSCITLFELRRLAERGALESETVRTLIEGIEGVSRVVWIDSPDLLGEAAEISHRFGLSGTDALVLAGFLRCGATAVYTTGSRMARYRRDSVRIVRLG